MIDIENSIFQCGGQGDQGGSSPSYYMIGRFESPISHYMIGCLSYLSIYLGGSSSLCIYMRLFSSSCDYKY